LQAALNGASINIFLPVDSLVPPATPPPNPAVTTIGPTEIEVERDLAQTVIPKPVSLLLAGTDLDQLDLTTVKAVVGNIQWIKAATVGSPTQTTPNIKLVGGKAIQLIFQVTSESPVVFQLTQKNSSTNILSLPLIVSPPRDLVIERTFGADKEKDTLRFSPTVAGEVVKAEIEKDKKHYPSQKADVKLRIDTDTRPKDPVPPKK
jgi:hypothetical protein